MKYFLALLIAGIAFLGGMLYTNETRATASAQTPNAISDSMATQDVDSRCDFYTPPEGSIFVDNPSPIYIESSKLPAFPQASTFEPCNIVVIHSQNAQGSHDAFFEKTLDEETKAFDALGASNTFSNRDALGAVTPNASVFVNPLPNGAIFARGISGDPKDFSVFYGVYVLKEK